MLNVIREIDIDNFDDLYEMCWSGALDRLNEARENDIEEEFFDYIVEQLQYNDYLTETTVNDFIWFECDDWLEEHEKED